MRINIIRNHPNIIPKVITALVVAVFFFCCPVYATEYGPSEDATEITTGQNESEETKMMRPVKIITRNTGIDGDELATAWGNISGTWTFEYNEDGTVSSKTREEDDGTITKFEYVYNKKGLPLKETVTKNDNRIYSKVYGYYPSGTIASETERFEEERLTLMTSYDRHGNCIRRAKLRPDGVIKNLSVYRYEYDDNGRILKEEKETSVRNGHGEYDTTTEKKTYEYDKNGLCIKEQGNDYWIDRTFENGVLVKEKYITDIVTETDYQYDENGMILSVVTTEKGNVTDETKYEYDDKGALVSISTKDGRYLNIQRDFFGRVLYTSQKDENGTYQLNKYQYGENGFLQRHVMESTTKTWEQETAEFRHTWEYDEKGRILKYSVTQQRIDDKPLTFEQEYIYPDSDNGEEE